MSLSDKRKKLRKDIDYLFSKIDWGNSFLDAKAIRIMNEFMSDIIEADKQFIRKQLDNISEEQKIAKGRDWQRSLLKLKAELEIDAGEALI